MKDEKWKATIFSKESTESYLIRPDPAVGPGLRVRFKNTGEVGLGMVGTRRHFALSRDAAIQLLLLLQAKIGAEEGFSVAEEPEP